MKEDYEEIRDSVGGVPLWPLCPSCLGSLECCGTLETFGCPSCEVIMRKEAVLWSHWNREYLEINWLRKDNNNDTTD